MAYARLWIFARAMELTWELAFALMLARAALALALARTLVLALEWALAYAWAWAWALRVATSASFLMALPKNWGFVSGGVELRSGRILMLVGKAFT